jgi:hypothetical protein
VGGDDGYAVLWVPVITGSVFAVFGAREGGLWGAVALLAATAALFASHHGYPQSFVWRVLPIGLLVTVLAGALEAARSRAVAGFRQEQAARAEAARQVRALAGLLPICCRCKRIRDDQGTWHELETYIEERTEAQFTHGICQPCTDRLYPEVADRVRDRRPPAPVAGLDGKAAQA